MTPTRTLLTEVNLHAGYLYSNWFHKIFVVLTWPTSDLDIFLTHILKHFLCSMFHRWVAKSNIYHRRSMFSIPVSAVSVHSLCISYETNTRAISLSSELHSSLFFLSFQRYLPTKIWESLWLAQATTVTYSIKFKPIHSSPSRIYPQLLFHPRLQLFPEHHTPQRQHGLSRIPFCSCCSFGLNSSLILQSPTQMPRSLWSFSWSFIWD